MSRLPLERLLVERVVACWLQGRHVEFKGGRRTVASRLQADPAQPVARRGRLKREGLVPVQGPDRVAAPQLFLSHHLRLPGEPERSRALFVWISA